MVDYAREDPGVLEPHTYGLGPAAAPAVLQEFGIIGGPRKAKDPMIPALPAGTMTIVSVFPRIAFNKVFNFGHYEIDPCPPCESHGSAPCERCNNYAKLVVTATRESIDEVTATDGSRRRLNVITAPEVARSLLTDGCLDRGVFVCQGDEPTLGELAEAREVFRKWAESAVKQADEVWGQKRDAAYINPLARDAAKYLKAKRDWLSETESLVDCESCGNRNRKGVIVCSECKYPVDWQRAYIMGSLNEKQEAYARKKGLIHDEEEAEDEVFTDTLKEGSDETPVKRGPGRPRKNPIV